MGVVSAQNGNTGKPNMWIGCRETVDMEIVKQ